MGYTPDYRKVNETSEGLQKAKVEPKEILVKMYLKEPKNLLQRNHRIKLAKILVELVLFDFELGILEECIFKVRQSMPGLNCTILDAWEARKKTGDGVEGAISYFYNKNRPTTNTSGGTEAAAGYRYRNPPANNVSERPKNTSGGVNAVVDNFRKNAPADNIVEQPRNTSGGAQAVAGYAQHNPPANNVTEPPVDPSTLPPPDLGGIDEFESVPPHINPSSHFDDDDNQLIKDSTQLGYRNPPVAGNLKPVADSTAYPPVTEGYTPPDWLPTDTSSATPVVASFNRGHKFDEVSNAPQGQCTNARLGNQSQYGNAQPPNVSAFSSNTVTTVGSHSQAPPPTSSSAAASSNRGHKIDITHPEESSTSAFSQGQYANTHLGNELQYGNTAITGPLRSLPSVPISIPPTDGSDAGTQLASLPHHKLNKQKSMPNDGSLSGNMAAVATGPTNSNKLAVSDNIPVMADVPLTDRPTPEASQAPPTADSKYGKTNLNYLKGKLQHKKVVTQTVVQTGGAVTHPQLTSDYVNVKTLVEGTPDTTNKPNVGKPDLTSLRSRLEKTKEEREKATKKGDYYNLSDISTYVPENPVTIKNPADKKPMAVRRTKAPANLASSNTHSASSKITYKLWQCAHCQKINEVHHTSCERCKLPPGKMADRSYFCDFCQMMIFIPPRKDFKDTSCPRCYQVYESTL